jgi:hypothetical protein
MIDLVFFFLQRKISVIITGVDNSGVEIGVVLLLLRRIAEPKSKSHSFIGVNESARSTKMFSGFKSLYKQSIYKEKIRYYLVYEPM